MTMPAQHPVVLDMDSSVGRLPGELRVQLQHWQEAIRFGCRLARFVQFRKELERALPQEHGTVLMGSGDFHHLSWPLIERCIAQRGFSANRPLRVVVLDNHPDNMRFPWGIHCGSWVRRVALHPAVSHVHVAGITSGDIGRKHAWENYLAPLRAGKLTYWSSGVETGWARHVGAAMAFRNFPRVSELVHTLARTLREAPQPTYLSIDKDVFAREVIQTNWDQGQMLERESSHIIEALHGQVVASDMTGDVSSWRYTTWWKRMMSAGDGQDMHIDAATLSTWQADQHALNLRLLERIVTSRAP